MPPVPEILNTVSHIWGVEVFKKSESKHLGHSQGHITVAAEIIINLKGIGQGSDPGRDHIHLTAGSV